MECEANLAIMSHTCKLLGFSVQSKKLVYPTTVLEYIGIIIDSDLMQLRISTERLTEITIELNMWKNRKQCTKRELLSLIGKLSFVARVVRSGRTFLRRLIDESKKAKYLHYRISLSKAMQQDVDWWISYLPSWNGVSMIYENTSSTNADLNLWTDASDWGV